jgi:hypothetical protein
VKATVSSSTPPYDGQGALQAMDKAGTAALGVMGGADPLLVHVPSFTVKAIAQAMPLAGASNQLTLTLALDCDMMAGSNITVSGLTGSETASTDALTVVGAGVSNLGSWRQDSSTLVLWVGSSMMANGSTYTVSFDLRNSAERQDPPSVSVSATIASAYGPGVSTVASTAMDKSGMDAVGVRHGAAALLVHEPGFEIKAIGQSNPLAWASNTLTLTLSPDCDMAAGSNVTVYGLTGTETGDSDELGVGVVSGP